MEQASALSLAAPSGGGISVFTTAYSVSDISNSGRYLMNMLFTHTHAHTLTSTQADSHAHILTHTHIHLLPHSERARERD